MFNKVILVGNLTRDMELRYLPSGMAVATTGIATNRRFKKQDGTQTDEVMFIDITFFGRTAEIANQYLRRGSKVLVEGRLKLDQWTDQNGAKRSKHGVTVDTLQMLDSKTTSEHDNNFDEGVEYNQNLSSQRTNNTKNTKSNSMPEINIDADEVIPF